MNFEGPREFYFFIHYSFVRNSKNIKQTYPVTLPNGILILSEFLIFRFSYLSLLQLLGVPHFPLKLHL
jgi:hypothetical protein